VIIRGDGVAANCCAYLLTNAGFRIDLQPVTRPRLPVILLGDQALALIRDIFGRPDLFADLPRIRKRIVAWGPGASPIMVQHSAVVVSEEALLDAIRPVSNPLGDLETQWTILAARPLPAPAVEHSFGTRMASAAPVTMKPGSDPDACWIESLEDGWLFLVPGWLLAVGATVETLLGTSRVIANVIANVDRSSSEFPAYARIASPVCAPSWLACGTAAMAFDPICGDGTAHAIREAILASAVIRALANGGPAIDLLSHYEARLTAGFRRHLAECRQFYRSGGTGPLWRSELEAIHRGIEVCTTALANHTGFRYQLRGLELETVR
jgi:2-polyprenyl-6-methoxyphenol hydroxylase-like FAD-dependent oxidoreductase